MEAWACPHIESTLGDHAASMINLSLLMHSNVQVITLVTGKRLIGLLHAV